MRANAAHSDTNSRVQIYFSNISGKGTRTNLTVCERSIKVAPIRDKFDKCVVDDDVGVGSMTKIRCRICELLGADQGLNHGLSHPCHLTNLNHLRPGLNYSSLPNMNYLNHGLLNGLYLPQLKDMMLAAYLLRGKDQTSRYAPRARRETRDFYTTSSSDLFGTVILSTNDKRSSCLCDNLRNLLEAIGALI